MQLQNEAPESATTLGWICADLLTIPIALGLLALGFAVTRSTAWLQARSLPKQPPKKVDKLDQEPEVEGMEEIVVKARSATEARRSNAQGRKRSRKAKSSEQSQELPPAEFTPVAIEADQHDEPPLQKTVPTCAVPISMEAAEQSDPPPSQGVLPTIHVDVEAEPQSGAWLEAPATKAEALPEATAMKPKRKARKQKKNAGQATQNPRTSPILDTNFDADPLESQMPLAVAEVKSDSDSLSQDGHTASTPSTLSMVSGAIESSESDTSPLGSKHCDLKGCDSPADQMAHADAEGDATVLEEELDLHSERLQNCAVAPDIPQDGLAPAVDEISDEGRQPQDDIEPAVDEIADEGASDVEIIGHINFDGLQAEVVSIDGLENICLENISTPDEVQGMPGMANPPIMWCGMPDEMPQVEWVPVAVPIEYAPAGPFDGMWTNKEEERILIDKLQIVFDGDITWQIEMHSPTNLSVHVDGKEHTAEFDGCGKLHWSDGDVWTYLGPNLQAPADMTCMPLPFVPMPPQSQLIPRNAKKWEMCWDWAKKGCCPRGVNCEWYHPEPDAEFF